MLKKIIIIKDGDHSLSQIKNLKKIIAELDRFSKKYYLTPLYK